LTVVLFVHSLTLLVFFPQMKQLYDQKADVREGKDDDWMDGWLQSFVDEHGVGTVQNLLNDYIVNV
jgi:hypothetical protein